MRLSGITYIVTALVVAVVTAGIALSARPAAASNDVSADWSVSYALSCTGTFSQMGDSLTASVDCGGGLEVNLSGTIDYATRNFSLTGDFVGYPVDVHGTASMDGSSLSGTWSAPPFVTDGPFSAARSGSGSATDLSGTWGLTVQGIFAGSCTASIERDGAQLTAQVACEPGPSSTFTGTFDESAGTFSISGPFSQFTSLLMEGTLAQDGDSFEGTWFIDPSGPGGVLTGERIGGGPEATPTHRRAQATPTASIALPSTGGGAGGGGAAGWVYGAIAAAVALSAASYVAFRRVR